MLVYVKVPGSRGGAGGFTWKVEAHQDLPQIENAALSIYVPPCISAVPTPTMHHLRLVHLCRGLLSGR